MSTNKKDNLYHNIIIIIINVIFFQMLFFSLQNLAALGHTFAAGSVPQQLVSVC